MENIIISDTLAKAINDSANAAKVESRYHEDIMNEIETMDIPEMKKRALYECIIEYLYYGQWVKLTMDDMMSKKRNLFRSMKCPYCKQEIMKFK